MAAVRGVPEISRDLMENVFSLLQASPEEWSRVGMRVISLLGTAVTWSDLEIRAFCQPGGMKPETHLSSAATGKTQGAALGLAPSYRSGMPVASSGLPGQSQVGVLRCSQAGVYLFLSSKSGNGPGSFFFFFF